MISASEVVSAPNVDLKATIMDYPKIYSKHAEVIISAHKRGYIFDFKKLAIVTPNGTVVIPKLYGKQKYPTLTINDNTGTKHNVSCAIHKFVAYQLYGEIALRRGVNVRHLDADRLNLNSDNIVLGTSRDNNLDKPARVRKEVASKARRLQGVRPLTTKVSDEDAKRILMEYLRIKGSCKRAKRGTIDLIKKKYPYSKPCLQAICSGHSFPDIYIEVLKECK